ncbi:MAG: hypothetical protein K2Q22_11940 [Cytophagales bacterium]|nr:hypothetical protein [Cytophagales bacterium]
MNEHNFILTDSFTAKYRPWELMIFVPVSEERKYAVRLEMAIKAKKSKVFIQKFLKYPDLRQKMVDQIQLT